MDVPTRLGIFIVKPYLIDSHCHLHFPAYAEDGEAVLARMREKNIWGLTVGTTIATSRSAVQYAEAHQGIWAVVGYHPEHFSSSFHDEAEGDADRYSIEEIAVVARSSKKVVAIGETGLDFFRIDEDRNREQAQNDQERGLREHLSLAHAADLPVVIHCREALGRLAEIIQSEQDRGVRCRGVVHCFTGSWEEAKPLLDLGFFLSFSGVVTFPVKTIQSAEAHVHRVIERMPLERMLIETDAPYLTPVPHRGEKNEPAHVVHVAQKIAQLRLKTEEEIARQTTENAIELFHLPS